MVAVQVGVCTAPVRSSGGSVAEGNPSEPSVRSDRFERTEESLAPPRHGRPFATPGSSHPGNDLARFTVPRGVANERAVADLGGVAPIAGGEARRPLKRAAG